MLKSLVFILISCVASLSFAQSFSWRDSSGVKTLEILQVVEAVKPGDIVVVGEEHGSALSQSGQLQVLQALRAQGLKVSVGMEFLNYPHQAWTDEYRAGLLSEPDFLEKVSWGQGFSFDFYRDQVLFPQASEGARTFALNIPRGVTSQVARGGLESLSEEQKSFLPPGLTRGNDRYFERFKAAMGGHVPSPIAAERYFMAQSIWDETMAWKALEAQAQDPQQVLVIVVGEFHVRHGGGLPDRLRARGASRVWTVSQVNLSGLSPEEQKAEIEPDPIDGPRADFLFLFD